MPGCVKTCVFWAFVVSIVNAGILQPLNAQNASTENSLTVRVKTSNIDPSRRFRELVDGNQWDSALEMISGIFSLSGEELVELNYEGRPTGTVTFVPVLDLMVPVIEAELVKRGPLLARWRRSFDPFAERLLNAARTSEPAQSIEFLQRIVEKYFLSSDGDQAMYELGLRLAERGELDQAIHSLARIDSRFRRFRTPRVDEMSGMPRQAYPDSDLPIAEVAARLVLLNAIRRPVNSSGTSQSDYEWFESQFPESIGSLGEREGRLGELLKQFLEESALATSSNAMDTESIPETEAAGRTLDPVARWGVQRLTEVPCYPDVINQSVVWRDSAAIYLADLKEGTPVFDNGLVVDGQESDERNRFSVWRPSDRLSGNGSRLNSFQQSRLSVDGSRVFGVFELRNSSYLVGVDLAREGKLLPGFPLLPPFADQSVLQFDGTPVVRDGRLYVVVRRTLPDNIHVVVSVLCYELILNDDGKPLPLLWETEICQSEIQRPVRLAGQSADPDANRLSRSVAAQLLLDEGRLFLNTHRGVMSCLAADSGDLKWIVRYPRNNWFGTNPDISRLPMMRTGQSVLAGEASVYMMPADNPDVFSINRQTGTVRWKTGLPAANQLLDLSGDTLLAGGYQLVWLDAESGALVCRYPGTFVNSRRGMRLPPGRGRGQAIVDNNSILFPTDGIIWQIEREPVLDSSGGAVARVLAKLERQEFTHGGHLAIEDGMMIFSGREELQAWQVFESTVNRTDIEQDP